MVLNTDRKRVEIASIQNNKIMTCINFHAIRKSSVKLIVTRRRVAQWLLLNIHLNIKRILSFSKQILPTEVHLTQAVSFKIDLKNQNRLQSRSMVTMCLSRTQSLIQAKNWLIKRMKNSKMSCIKAVCRQYVLSVKVFTLSSTRNPVS